MAHKLVVVTIDGPAGAGKSSVAKQLAQRLGYRLLDTGAIYRTVALVAQREEISVSDGAALGPIAQDLPIEFSFVDGTNRVSLAGEDVSAAIRSPDVSRAASHVSAHPEVRGALLELQRRLAAGGGVVVEGRDTGTVVFPQAEAKFYLTASDEVRAHRRVAELRGTGVEANFAETLADIQVRDKRDTERALAPLRPADDAIMVDSSSLPLDEVVGSMVAAVLERAGGTP